MMGAEILGWALFGAFVREVAPRAYRWLVLVWDTPEPIDLRHAEARHACRHPGYRSQATVTAHPPVRWIPAPYDWDGELL